MPHLFPCNFSYWHPPGYRGAPPGLLSLLASAGGIGYPTIWKCKGAKIAAVKEDMLEEDNATKSCSEITLWPEEA